MSSSVLSSSVLVNHSSLESSVPLWYEFEMCKESPYAFVFLYMIYVFNLVVGFPSNIMVMCHISRKKSDTSTSDIFIFNLAIVDAYFCLMTPSDLVNRLLLNNRYIWQLHRFAYGIKDSASLILTCICLDRYMAVVHPIVFSGIRDNKIRLAISMLVSGLMIAIALCKCILGVDSTRNIFTGLILGSFTIMVFCNISIIWTLRRSVMGKEEMHPVKKKAFRMVVIALGIIVFTYLPPVALSPFTEYFNIVNIKCHISVVICMFIDFSSSIEPLLYISKMDQCCAALPCCCFQRPSSEQHNVST